MKPFSPTREFALRLDAADPLARFRNEFEQPEPNLCYMDGNSLGRLPRRTAARLRSIIEEEWGRDLIRGWNNGWYQAPARLGDKIGQLIGAEPGQVIVCDSTSVNLYKLAYAALQLLATRQTVITDSLNFPSDIYILQGLLSSAERNPHRTQRNFNIVNIPADESDHRPDLNALYHSINEDTALITLSHVTFKSGYLYDMATITRWAHEKGALVLWDLSHSVGVVPIELDAWQVDFAIGCTYKYLNGGPGAPAFLYVNQRLQSDIVSPIWGWFGQNRPFDFRLEYTPAPGITRFLAGTPSILSLLAVEPGVELILEAGIPAIRHKSVALTEYFLALVETCLSGHGFTLGSPREPEQRGGHISLRHPEGYRINRALIEEMNVIPDFREPDNIRFGFAPLYTRFEDVWETVERLQRVMVEKRYKKYPEVRPAVT
ncbi:MAG: kynureninase [Anaerolineae bacterium]|nr:MAG: kynureninase [Anaerolineae bacterium]